jgi:hypothetical protein
MKFKDYLEQINAFAEDHPEAMDYDVVHASDDEGKDHYKVSNGPCTGYYEDYEFFFEEEIDNAICIN